MSAKFSGLSSLPKRGEVLEALFALWHPDLPAETVSVEDALGRVTAGECRSRLNLPVVRASSGDGIAVDSERFRDGVPDTSGWEMGRDFVRADTGDDFDDRFDAVIMIEDVDIGEGGRLRIRDGVTVRKGDNVRPSGSTVREGELLAPKHVPLRPRDLACLHLGGVWDVPVLRKPAVAFIPTGNELVPPRSAVVRGKNVDTNSVLARTSLQLLGAEPLLYPIVPGGSPWRYPARAGPRIRARTPAGRFSSRRSRERGNRRRRCRKNRTCIFRGAPPRGLRGRSARALPARLFSPRSSPSSRPA